MGNKEIIVVGADEQGARIDAIVRKLQHEGSAVRVIDVENMHELTGNIASVEKTKREKIEEFTLTAIPQMEMPYIDRSKYPLPAKRNNRAYRNSAMQRKKNKAARKSRRRNRK